MLFKFLKKDKVLFIEHDEDKSKNVNIKFKFKELPMSGDVLYHIKRQEYFEVIKRTYDLESRVIWIQIKTIKG
jgi:hypothetical protein